MKKRILSLLCVLALCLGLLPVTALAAAEGAPNNLYVGNQNVKSGEDTTYWTTDLSTGKLTLYTENGDDWNVKYDPNSATLTLCGATINGAYDATSLPYGAGIYAQGSSNQAVALTIELIGNNTITGNYGIYLDGHQGNTICTNASLLIKNGNESGESGSLTVTGTTSYGLYVISGTGNASVTIENASVDAKTTQTYSSYAGVCVQSGASATNSPQLSLAVKGGSLTTSASEGNDGIQFYVGSSSDTTNATTSLTISDNAIVRAENGIKASRVDKPTPSGTGIVFDGTEGTVYGDVTLNENLTIGEGESLTIPEGSTLNMNGNTITVENGGTLEGTPTGGGTVVYKVSGVALEPDKLNLYTGDNTTLEATVAPNNATNKNVTWESNNPDVATVVDGKVTAVKAGEATITVTTEDGGYTATCTVKVTDPVYDITTDPTALDFGKAYTDYTQPAAQTVTITNNGNQQVTVTLPTATDFVITEGNGFASGSATIAPGKTATFTVQPKADLAAGNHEESINISGQSGSNPVSTSVDASFAIVDINSTQVKTDLNIASDITEGISGTAFDTPEAVKAELTRVLVQDAAYTAGNTAFYDVKLQYSLDNGPWFDATEATFPTEGITVTLPYPTGTGKDTHNFRVVHMFTLTSSRLGTEAGKTETPAVTKTDSGLQVTLRGLSPVVIGWDKIESPAPAPTPDDSIYYTCKVCGYHNWTATEAGYRCDHCGNLVADKQLAGYPNVKGVYTPAASPAASGVTSPQTGDESHLALWLGLLAASALALGGIAIAKRKKQQ